MRASQRHNAPLGQSFLLKVRSMTREQILAALDKPRTTHAVLLVVNPSGSVEEIQIMLMKMRDEGLVKFDINRGWWSRA
jgi:hypothetical protein